MRLMAKSLYPLDSPKQQPAPKKISIHLSKEEQAEVQMVADLFNAMDRARGVKRQGRKWERKSVLEHFIRTSLNNFWEQIGGRPESFILRDGAVKAAIAALEKEHAGRSRK